MMDIQISYDASTTSAPSWFKSAVAYVVAQYDALITNPISLTIAMGWGEENGAAIKAGTLAQNQSSGTYLGYAAFTAALKNSATTGTDQAGYAALPAADPTNGGQFYVPLALQKAIGTQPASTPGTVDGYVGLDSSRQYTFSPGGQIAAGTYDVISVLEHEFSEVFGRVGYLGGSTPNVYGPADLFRYTGAGQRDTTPGAGSFSVDGQTMLQAFNNPLGGGDVADWASSVYGDTFGDTTAGLASHFSSTDYALLDVLGYSVNGQGMAPTATSLSAAAAPAAASADGGSATATGSSPHRIVASYDGEVSGTGNADTFVFRAHPGQAWVQDFQALGADHDVLSFSKQNFSSVADILRHTTMSGGDAVVHVSTTESVEIFGVTKAQLRQNMSTLSLHA